MLIPLTNGGNTVIDDEDFPLVEARTWRKTMLNGKVYVVSGKRTFLHRIITNAPPNREVDHKDGDGLNNQRSNLRVCLHKDNMKNRKQSAHSKQPYKGVERRPSGKWMATIYTDKKRIRIGLFDSAYLAALAYDKASRFYHGEFGRPNFQE